MTTLKQSFVAAKYHKKITIFYFLIFSLFLFSFTLISQLVQTQNITLKYIMNKWDSLRSALPQITSGLNDQLIESNHYVTSFYNDLFLALVFFSIVFFFLLSFYASKIRKDEIDSMYYIGIKRSHILKYLLLELISPIFISISSLLLLLILFHGQFINESVNINKKIVDNYFEEQSLVFTQTHEDADLTNTTNQNKKKMSSKNDTKTILPYNKVSLFDVSFEEISFKNTLKNYIRNSLILIATTIVGSLAGYSSYISLCSYRRVLPE